MAGPKWGYLAMLTGPGVARALRPRRLLAPTRPPRSAHALQPARPALQARPCDVPPRHSAPRQGRKRVSSAARSEARRTAREAAAAARAEAAVERAAAAREAAAERAAAAKARARREREALLARGPPPPPTRTPRLPPWLLPDLLTAWQLLMALAPLLQARALRHPRLLEAL